MVNFTTHELRLIAEKRGIKKLPKYVKRKVIKYSWWIRAYFQKYITDGLERIAKMQNLSQNQLDQITKIKNLPQNELEKIAKMRHIKNHKNMSKEGLLIALLKSKQSPDELYKSKSNNVQIEEIKKFF